MAEGLRKYILSKVLINIKSTINLISERVIKFINLQIASDTFTSMKVINEDWTILSEYTHINMKVKKLMKKILVAVVSKDTLCILLLKHLWLWSIQGVNIYEMSEYWIQDNDEIQRKLNTVQLSQLILTSQIHVSEHADWAHLPYNQCTFKDLNFIWEERINLVLQEIIEQAKEEKNDNDKIDENFNEKDLSEFLEFSLIEDLISISVTHSKKCDKGDAEEVEKESKIMLKRYKASQRMVSQQSEKLKEETASTEKVWSMNWKAQ